MQFGPFEWNVERRQLRVHGEVVPLDAPQVSVLAAIAETGKLHVATAPLRSIVNDRGHLDAEALWEVVGSINELLHARGGGRAFIAHHPNDGFFLVGGSAARVVGRDDAVARIDVQLATHRFVTIVGPGGLGKTTVARLLVDKLRAGYPDGVHVVDLFRLADGALVAPATAAAMGLVLAGSDPLVSLAAFARHKKLLLFLDSCEHVAEGAACVAEAMLSAGGGVHVLATSREPLLAAGERLHRLAALETRPAVELFVQRVAELEAGFEPAAEDLERIATICRTLDGLPLAIEIVAARASELGLSDLSSQLDARLLSVEGASPGAPSRHQTLGAMMDWSHDQLGLVERLVLRQLSIFRGSFTLEAAQAVVAAPGVHAAEVGGVVLDLVDKSLVSRTAGAKFRLLDTTRVYAATKLQDEEHDALSGRHARYLLAVLQRAEADWLEMEVRAWRDAYGEWIDDLRLALDSSFGLRGDAQLGVELAFAGFELGRQLSLDAEFRRHMQHALAVLGQQPVRDYVTEITLKAYLGSMAQLMDPGGEQLHRSLEEMLDREGSRMPARVQVIAVGSINHAALMAADFPVAAAWADRAITAARDSADAVAFTIAERMSAQARHFMGWHDDAWRLAASVLASGRRIPLTYIPSPVQPRVSMRLLLARVHWMQGRPASAAAWAGECMEQAESDTAISRCQALAMCAVPLALWNRENDAAREHVKRLRQVAEGHSLAYWLYWAERMEFVLALDPDDRQRRPDARLFKAGTAEANLRDHLCTFDPCFLGDDVKERVDKGLVGWCAPEVLRARAIAAMGPVNPDAALAKRLLHESLALARSQGALAWELRTATTLARWLGSTAEASDACVQLAAIIARFDEGVETADLLEARQVLAGFSAPGSRAPAGSSPPDSLP